MTDKRAGKRALLGVLIFFLAGILLAAYIANQIHLRSLPVVETIVPASGTLRNRTAAEAALRYTHEIVLRAPAALRVASIKKSPGDRIRAGDPLFTFDLEDVRIALLSCQAEESELRRNGESELNALLLSRMENQIGQLQALLSMDGKVTSPVNGWVLSLDVRAGDRLTEYDPVITLCDEAGGKELLWKQPDDGVMYTSALLTMGQESFTLRNFETRCDPQTGEVYTAAGLPEAFPAVLPPGRKISVELHAEARPYDLTLPLSCLCRDAAGREYVYLIQEKETARGTITCAVQRTVYVLDRDQANFSFTPALEAPVILTHTQSIADQTEVRLAE